MPHAHPKISPLLAAALLLTLGANPSWAQNRPQPGANPVQPGANPNQNPNPRPQPRPTQNQGTEGTPLTLEGLNPDAQSDQPILATPRELDFVPRLLSDQRWQEHSYGLSFQVPAGAILDSTVTPQRVAAVILPDKYEITVQILSVQSILPNSRGQIQDIPEEDSAFMPGRVDRNNIAPSGKRIVESQAIVPVLDNEELLTIKEINKIAVNQQLRFLKAENYGCFKVRMFKDLIFTPPPPPPVDPELAKQPDYVPPPPPPPLKIEPGFTAYVSYFSYVEKRPNPKNTIEAGKETGESMVMGELVVMLSPKTFLSVRLRTNAQDLEKSQQVFESMLSSFKCMSQAQMTEFRKKLLDDGEAAITTRKTLANGEVVVTPKKLPTSPQAYPGRLWYRVMEGDKDVGYMRITDGIDTVNKQTGVRVLIETKTYRNNIGFTGESDFFLPHDHNLETWSIKLAEERPGAAPATPGLGSVRPSNPRSAPPSRSLPNAPSSRPPVADPTLRTPPPPPPLFWSETGTYDNQNKSVVVTRQTTMKNASNEPIEWKTPAVAYLGQVQSLLIQRLLPTDKPGMYGFYCYNPQAGNIFFRTERVVPDPSGKGCTIYTRASPEQREIVSKYDELGRLTQRELPNGQTIKSVNPSELTGIWSQKTLR